jgi:hypothetical protein
VSNIARGSLIAAVVVLVTGCGAAVTSGGQPRAPVSSAVPAVTCVPGQIAPVGASFTSAADGWLLGITMRDCSASASSRIVVRKTTDGGRHWLPVPAPPAPWGGGPAISRDAVSSILFADPRDGWAFGPGLWATHDGGATWHLVDTGGHSVYSMAATDGHVVAAFLTCGTECGRGAASSFTVETTPAGSDAWRPVPGAAGTGEPVMTAAAGTAYAVGSGAFDSSPTALLTGPAGGTSPWQRHGTQCPGIAAIAASAVTAHSLVLACTPQGAHPAPTRLLESGDSGAHWRSFGHLAMYDGPAVIEMTAGGTLLAAGIYDGIALSRDGGLTWQRPAAVDGAPQTGGGGTVVAAMTSDETGYAIVYLGPMWITADGGRTWTQVTVR